jgi:hypothetical protein
VGWDLSPEQHSGMESQLLPKLGSEPTPPTHTPSLGYVLAYFHSLNKTLLLLCNLCVSTQFFVQDTKELRFS